MSMKEREPITTEAQTSANEGVPRYFTDFIQENARQHSELADRISDAKVDLIKWMIGMMLGGIIALGGLSYAILRILVDALD